MNLAPCRGASASFAAVPLESVAFSKTKRVELTIGNLSDKNKKIINLKNLNPKIVKPNGKNVNNGRVVGRTGRGRGRGSVAQEWPSERSRRP